MEEAQSKTTVKCCVKNCQKEISKEDAIIIEGKFFCKICGVHYYRNMLKL